MVVAILQARFSSTRLPGKVLKSILGDPMLLHQLRRIKRSTLIDSLVVATSLDTLDDDIEQLCLRNDIKCFRGSLNDVLDRFYNAAKKFNAKVVVRLTGDCPLTDSSVIDKVIQYYLDNDFDYASNAVDSTYPDGLDVEVFSFEALEQAWKYANLPSQREHVTPFIRDNFKVGEVKNKIDLSYLRWTVDEPEDFEFVTKIYEMLYESNQNFGFQDVLNLIVKNPELILINSKFERNEGYKKSLIEDEFYKKEKVKNA